MDTCCVCGASPASWDPARDRPACELHETLSERIPAELLEFHEQSRDLMEVFRTANGCLPTTDEEVRAAVWVVLRDTGDDQPFASDLFRGMREDLNTPEGRALLLDEKFAGFLRHHTRAAMDRLPLEKREEIIRASLEEIITEIAAAEFGEGEGSEEGRRLINLLDGDEEDRRMPGFMKGKWNE